MGRHHRRRVGGAPARRPENSTGGQERGAERQRTKGAASGARARGSSRREPELCAHKLGPGRQWRARSCLGFGVGGGSTSVISVRRDLCANAKSRIASMWCCVPRVRCGADPSASSLPWRLCVVGDLAVCMLRDWFAIQACFVLRDTAKMQEWCPIVIAVSDTYGVRIQDLLQRSLFSARITAPFTL